MHPRIYIAVSFLSVRMFVCLFVLKTIRPSHRPAISVFAVHNHYSLFLPYMSIRPYVCSSICGFIHLWVYLSVCPSTHQCVNVASIIPFFSPTYISICLSVCLSVRLFFCRNTNTYFFSPTFLYVSLCPYFRLSISMSVLHHNYFLPFLTLHICRSVCPKVCVPLFPFARPPIYLQSTMNTFSP